uniref:putative reverse transcriptase/maturase n=1 Tax=Goniotrichopsis reniformis TaxID=468933 RepID=UPI001FCD13AB|nr:putative reverse transcriptase/maturase [Goniotrichopsis reniformis]UNJ14786.1 putative reverse transcriptase/maturase [Goniotrichopsis reniformis]
MSIGLEILQKIYQQTKKNPNIVYQKLFFLLCQQDLYQFTYKRVCRQLSLNGYNFKKSGDTFSFSMLNIDDYCKKTLIPRDTNKVSLQNLRSIILQEMICLILDAIYAHKSYSFQYASWSHASPHLPLYQLEQNLNKTCKIIHITLTNQLDESDYANMIQFLANKIQDIKFLKLLDKLLKTNVLNECSKIHSLSYLMKIEGSRFIYWMWDIYYTKVDNYWYSENPKENLDSTLVLNKLNNRYQKNHVVYSMESEIINISDPEKYLKPKYIRYGNQIIIFLYKNTNYDYNFYIQKLSAWYQYLKVSCTLTENSLQIQDIQKKPLDFLGYKISMATSKVSFTISLKRIKQLFLQYKFVRYRHKNSLWPISKTKWVHLSDFKIVKIYHEILYNISNYYSGISQQKNMVYLEYILRFSCAMTLAHKHKSTVKKIFAKYGKNLIVQSSRTPYQVICFKDNKTNMVAVWKLNTILVDPFSSTII